MGADPVTGDLKLYCLAVAERHGGANRNTVDRGCVMAEDVIGALRVGTRMDGDRKYARPARVFVGRRLELAALTEALAARTRGRAARGADPGGDRDR